MSVFSELAAMTGVIAAGEYSYRGDRYNYRGQLSDEMARMASIMCRATTMSTHMQSGILCASTDDCPFEEAHGWVVKGPQFTVCVMANVFCFMRNEPGVLNPVFRYMREHLMDAHEAMV